MEVKKKINEEIDEIMDSISEMEWMNKVSNGSEKIIIKIGENGKDVK